MNEKTEDNKTAGIYNSRISRYSSLAIAKQAKYHSEKSSMIILGDDEKFWVVCMADAQRLVNAGYELAE